MVRGRTPPVACNSAGDRRSWDEPGPGAGCPDGGGHCYPAIRFGPGAVLVGHCAGREEDRMCLARLRVRRIPYGELS